MLNRRSTEQGLTLVEVIVALTLFVTLTVIASGTVLTLLDSNRNARAKQLVSSNISFILEDLSKNMRVGTNYHCGGTGGAHYSQPQDCVQGTERDELAYTAENGSIVVYRYNPNGTLEKSTEGGASGTWMTLTAPEVQVDTFQVYVHGSSSDDDFQPRAIISMTGSVDLPEDETQTFRVQTSITQRVLDKEI